MPCTRAHAMHSCSSHALSLMPCTLAHAIHSRSSHALSLKPCTRVQRSTVETAPTAHAKSPRGRRGGAHKSPRLSYNIQRARSLEGAGGRRATKKPTHNYLTYMSHFAPFDTNNSNQLGEHELRQCLISLGCKKKLGDAKFDKLVLHSFTVFDKNKDGALDFEEFMNLYKVLRGKVCHTLLSSFFSFPPHSFTRRSLQSRSVVVVPVVL